MQVCLSFVSTLLMSEAFACEHSIGDWESQTFLSPKLALGHAAEHADTQKVEAKIARKAALWIRAIARLHSKSASPVLTYGRRLGKL